MQIFTTLMDIGYNKVGFFFDKRIIYEKNLIFNLNDPLKLQFMHMYVITWFEHGRTAHRHISVILYLKLLKH